MCADNPTLPHLCVRVPQNIQEKLIRELRETIEKLQVLRWVACATTPPHTPLTPPTGRVGSCTVRGWHTNATHSQWRCRWWCRGW